jgi:hypothetical protein
LKQKGAGNLLRMALARKEKNCPLGGLCSFLLQYQDLFFYVSEILGQGCLIEKFRRISEENVETAGIASEERISLWVSGFRLDDSDAAYPASE